MRGRQEDSEPPAPAAGPPQATHRRRRLAIAAGGSAASHAALLLGVLWSVTTNGFEGGAGSEGGEDQAVTVTLVGPIGGARSLDQATARSASAQLSTMLDKFQQAPSPIPATARPSPRGDAAQLFEEISQSHGGASNSRKPSSSSQDAGAGENGSSTQTSAVKGKDGRAKAVEGHADDRGDQGHMTGDIWSQIETCWRPVAVVPITLEVVIDNKGRLAAPPRILRPQGASVDEKRLHAEALAVRAVADCAPFRSGAPLFGQKTYRFAFSPRS